MWLWLLCCGVLFVGTQTYQWLGHQPWFGTPQWGWPWLGLGGLGLAIASNYGSYRQWRALTLSPEPSAQDVPTVKKEELRSPAAPNSSPAVEPSQRSAKPELPHVELSKIEVPAMELGAQHPPIKSRLDPKQPVAASPGEPYTVKGAALSLYPKAPKTPGPSLPPLKRARVRKPK